jgi:hypothetical protein
MPQNLCFITKIPPYKNDAAPRRHKQTSAGNGKTVLAFVWVFRVDRWENAAPQTGAKKLRKEVFFDLEETSKR